MKDKCINFKEKKIENFYLKDSYTFDLPENWLDLSIRQQNEWFNIIKTGMSLIDSKNVLLNVVTDIKLTEFEQLFIMSKMAEVTITNKDLGIGYLAIPKWFGEHLFCTVDIQKKMGNYKNKFDNLQIILKNNKNEILEVLVDD